MKSGASCSDGDAGGGGGSGSAAVTFQDKVAASMKNLHGWAQNLEANIVIIAKQHNKLCEVVGKEKTETCLLKVVPPPAPPTSSTATKMDTEPEPEEEKKKTYEKGAAKKKEPERETPDSK
jgi:hypothetical protein